jgi:hypothetical protein
MHHSRQPTTPPGRLFHVCPLQSATLARLPHPTQLSHTAQPVSQHCHWMIHRMIHRDTTMGLACCCCRWRALRQQEHFVHLSPVRLPPASRLAALCSTPPAHCPPRRPKRSRYPPSRSSQQSTPVLPYGRAPPSQAVESCRHHRSASILETASRPSRVIRSSCATTSSSPLASRRLFSHRNS